MRLAPDAEIAPGIRLVRPLGHGAMGAVWLADREAEGDQVAVKVMPERVALTRGMAERFKREAELTAKIQSHHVVRLLGYGQTDGTAYILLEKLDGETLEARLEREGRLSPAFTARIVAQLGAALQAAHDVDVIHRDVKPANLFLVGGGDSPVLKVLDFGAAKPHPVRGGSIITATGVAVGSPFLMSPEQVLGSRFVDFRSDLWAFACVVYQMLCGELPFTADNPSALAFMICKATYRQASKLGAPPGLDGWFARSFQPVKENRFDSAREMADEFMGALIEDDEIDHPRFSPFDDDDETTHAEETLVRPREAESVAARGDTSEAPDLPEPSGRRDDAPRTEAPVQLPARRASYRSYGLAAAAVVVLGLAVLLLARSEDPQSQPAAVAVDQPPAAEPPIAGSANDAPAETTEPSSAPSEPDGLLTVICIPLCSKVEVDGQGWGPSPIVEHPAAPGEHAILLHRPGLPPKQVSVTVVAGKLTVQRVAFEASAKASASTAASAASAPSIAPSASVAVPTGPSSTPSATAPSASAPQPVPGAPPPETPPQP